MAKEIKNLTLKKLRFACTNGKTLEGLSSDYGVSPSEMEAHIRWMCTKKSAEEILKSLKANKKHSDRKKEAKQQIPEDFAALYGENPVSDGHRVVPASQDDNTESIEDLKRKIEDDSNVCAELESQGKQIAERLAQNAQMIDAIYLEAGELLEKLKGLEKRLQALNAEGANLNDEKKSVDEAISLKRKELEDSRKKLKDLLTVEICVFASGEVTISEGKLSEPARDIMEFLISDPLSKKAMLGELLLLCQLIPFVEQLKKEGKKVEIAFENSLIEELFNKYSE